MAFAVPPKYIIEPFLYVEIQENVQKIQFE